jgi:TetR/AcrR family transcriptional repressor of nem operon
MNEQRIMVRPRQFNEQQVIDKALHIFRKQGYQGSSLHDLMRAMAISKSSFYDTFGSKHALFLTTLSRFHETGAIYNFIGVNADMPVKTSVSNVFKVLIDSIIAGDGGCLYGNCAVEFADADAEISNHIRNGINRLELMFSELIKQGQISSQIAKTVNRQSAARQLTATFYGLQVMAHAGLSREFLDEIAESAAAQLG